MATVCDCIQSDRALQVQASLPAGVAIPIVRAQRVLTGRTDAVRSHGRIEDESHFHVLIVSVAFEGQALLDRHRAVQALFTDETGRMKFHALRITAKTPAQWAQTQVVPAAPKCAGGDGRKPTDTTQFVEKAEAGGVPFAVGALRESDRAQWETLYRGYIKFYEREEPQAFYDGNFKRLLEDTSVHALVARDGDDDSRLLGLVHFVPHASMSGDVCYLQDLFTDPAARGKGVGTQLIKAVIEWCRAKGGISKVYWNTHESNPARKKLYDVVGAHKGFVKYQADV